jgi:hypothetical protein
VVCVTGLAVSLHWFLRWFAAALPRAEEAPEGGRVWPVRGTLAILGVVMLMFVAGLAAVGVTHQTAWLVTSPEPLLGGGRVPTARTQSSNNLKQICLAAHMYHDEHKSFPPGGTFDPQGRGLHGWMTLLLPYVEQQRLYNQIDLRLPWDHPNNRQHFQVVVKVFQHPLFEPKTADGWALSHYAGNVHVLGGDRPLTLKALEGRGTANTILAGEAAGHFKPWGFPANWRDPARGINRTPDGFGSPGPAPHGVQFLFADGSVRSFGTDTDPEFLELLSRPEPKK